MKSDKISWCGLVAPALQTRHGKREMCVYRQDKSNKTMLWSLTLCDEKPKYLGLITDRSF